MGEIRACQICRSTDLTVILDMGEQPLAERFDHPETYPLALQECGECTLVQLTWAVDPAEVFPKDHPYRTGHTRALVEHFTGLAGRVGRYLEPGDAILDVGCNDATFLRLVRNDVRKVGVEPTGAGPKDAPGIHVWQNYWTAETAAGIRSLYGPAKVVTATNVLAHVADVHDAVKGIAALLADDGVFVAEVGDLSTLVDGPQPDVVYHEHQRFFSVTSLSRLLGMHGLTVTEAERIPTHGGSLRVFARKLRTGTLGSRAWRAAMDLHHMLRDIAGKGELIYGVGATTRATPLIHYANIAQFIWWVVEVPGSEKIGHLMPGTEIPVVDESRLIEAQPPYALLFAWHIADSIMPKLRKAGYRGRFIVPLPEAKVLDI